MRYSFTFSALLAVAISAPISVPALPTLPLGNVTSTVGTVEGLTKDLPVRSLGLPAVPEIPDVTSVVSGLTKDLPVKRTTALPALPVAGVPDATGVVSEVESLVSVGDLTKSLPIRGLPLALPEVPEVSSVLEEVEGLASTKDLPVRALPAVPDVSSLVDEVKGLASVSSLPALPAKRLLGLDDVVSEVSGYLTKALDLLLNADADIEKIVDAAETLETSAIISSIESILNQVLALLEQVVSKETGLSLTQLNPTLGTVNGLVSSIESKIDSLTSSGVLKEQSATLKAEIKQIHDLVAGLLSI